MEFLKKIAREGGELPPSLKNMPVLRESLSKFHDAFQTLSSSRRWTMAGPASIPFSEIGWYFIVYGITDVEEREEYVAAIHALDDVYLSYHLKKRKT